ARSEAADVARAALKRQEPAQWDIDALVLGRRFPDANLTTWGGGIAANWTYQGWFTVGGDIVGESGGGDLALDGLTVGQASLRGGSIGLSARLRQGWPSFTLEAGLGGRVGLARVHATADATELGLWQEHGFSGTWGGPLATVRVGWKASRMVLLVGSVEAGTVTRQLVGFVARQPELLITGPWAALSVGVGIGADARAVK